VPAMPVLVDLLGHVANMGILLVGFPPIAFRDLGQQCAGSHLPSRDSDSYFCTNPRLLARVVPARSEMVTNLIAPTSDLLAPIPKCTTRT
jgi:hypothetical protein